jgi:hypothetical protein
MRRGLPRLQRIELARGLRIRRFSTSVFIPSGSLELSFACKNEMPPRCIKRL